MKFALLGVLTVLAISVFSINDASACDRRRQSCDEGSGFSAQCVTVLSNTFSNAGSAFFANCDSVRNHYALQCVRGVARTYGRVAGSMIRACGSIDNQFSLRAAVKLFRTYTSLDSGMVTAVSPVNCLEQAVCVETLVDRWDARIFASNLAPCTR